MFFTRGFRAIYTLFIIAALLFSPGCAKKEQKAGENGAVQSAQAKKTLTPEQYAQLDADIQKILASAQAQPPEPGSLEKIRTAFQNGKISKENAVLLAVQATSASGSLPPEYRGAEAESVEEINAELQWICDNRTKMSAELRQKLEPFILNSDDPKSYYHPQNRKEGKGLAARLLQPGIALAAPDASGPIVVNTMNCEGAARIHYYNPTAAAAENDEMRQKALKVKEAMEKAWPMFKTLLGAEPSNPIRVELVAMGDRGQAIPLTGGYTIRLNKILDFKNIQSVAAHELFHCFHFSMDLFLRVGTRDMNWLLEAAAKWSEDFVYPEYNVEHSWLQRFFQSLDQERVQFNGGHEYASYMLFFFLSQYSGSDGYVPLILRQAKNGQALDAVMGSITGYDDVYAEFALYNWDKEPWLAYQDFPSFPHPGAAGSAIDIDIVIDSGKSSYSNLLKKGAAKYIAHIFDNNVEKQQRVEFDFKTPSTDRRVHRQALVKIGNVWHREDWTDIASRSFCRKNPEQNVKAVILVLSNSDLKNDKVARYDLSTEGACGGLTGYTKITTSLNTGISNHKSEYISEDVLVYDAEKEAYVIKERTFRYTGESTGGTDVIIGPQDNEIKLGTMTGTVAEHGFLSEQYEQQEERPVKLKLADDGSITFVVEPKKKATRWVTRVENGQFLGVPHRKVEKIDVSPGGTFKLKESEIQNKKIKGRRDMGLGGVIEFEYDLK